MSSSTISWVRLPHVLGERRRKDAAYQASHAGMFGRVGESQPVRHVLSQGPESRPVGLRKSAHVYRNTVAGETPVATGREHVVVASEQPAIEPLAVMDRVLAAQPAEEWIRVCQPAIAEQVVLFKRLNVIRRHALSHLPNGRRHEFGWVSAFARGRQVSEYAAPTEDFKGGRWTAGRAGGRRRYSPPCCDDASRPRQREPVVWTVSSQPSSLPYCWDLQRNIRSTQ